MTHDPPRWLQLAMAVFVPLLMLALLAGAIGAAVKTWMEVVR